MKRLISAEKALRIKESIFYPKSIIRRANDAIIIAAYEGKNYTTIFTENFDDILLLQKELKKKSYIFNVAYITHEKTPYNWVREYWIRIEWL